MEIYTASQLRGMRVDQIFRTSRWGAALLPAVLLFAGVGCGWAVMNAHLPSLFWASSGLLALLAAYTFKINFWPSLKPSNWVLKLKGDQLYLMLRSYRNTHLPVPVIVSFDRSEIESIGLHEKQVSVPTSSGGTRRWKEQRLEIRLSGPLPQELIATLNEQPQWSETWYGRVKNDASPVSFDGQTIRIAWSGPSDGIVPRINTALRILSKTFPVHDPSVTDQSDPENMTIAELDHTILELCQSGNRLDAIKLLRRYRGYSLTEVKQFVESLSETPADHQ